MKSSVFEKTNTKVKGNAESSYRTGNVNLTPANLGAVSTNAGALINKDSSYRADGTDDQKSRRGSIAFTGADGSSYELLIKNNGLNLWNGSTSSNEWRAQMKDAIFVLDYDAEIWCNSNNIVHIRMGATGTQQADYSFEYDGIYANKRTRTSTSAAWGSWAGWKHIITI